ncbi:MAG: DUF1799 domain-containing protein [Saprospiraceae bacterium]|nr:DUF1799 domain-containing protein [Saprospiraceae bacterium]
MWNRKSESYCDACPRPGILPGNHRAWQLFQACDTQLITSFGGVVGLNFQAVACIAGWLKISMDEFMFTKLKTMESAYVGHLNTAEETAPKAGN